MFRTRTEILAATRERMRAVDAPQQVLGRSLSIGCTAVEITQRCNLDCKLCYLSENSQHVRDIPIEEVFRRIDHIRETFGPFTNIQITGGDPTLRKHSELERIVARARERDLFPALFTNGIAATPKLLRRLADAGLADVAFHVDTSQNRPGFKHEHELDALRLEYLERTSGTGLMVIFNTTVHAGNLDELPGLIRFFRTHAGRIGLASFQLQADTGRGAWGGREAVVSMGAVQRAIESEAGRALPWDAIRVGHPRCHKYLPMFVVGEHMVPAIEDAALFGRFLADFQGAHADRREGLATLASQYSRNLLENPGWLWRGARYLAAHLWHSRRALWQARGRVHQLSFFIHDFMDAAHLDAERIEACSFMVMAADGPVSMCSHNAARDTHILQPLRFRRRDGSLGHYEPLARRQA